MKKLIVTFLILLFSLHAEKISTEKDLDKIYQEEIEEKDLSKLNDIDSIDSEIKDLEDLKRGYLSQAVKHENQAQRLQFIEGQLQYAKRNWKVAAEYKRKARRVQKEIDLLRERKEYLLKK